MATENTEEKTGENLSHVVTQAIQEIVEPDNDETPEKGSKVTLLPDGQLLIDEKPYGLIYNHREGFDAEKLGERFSEILARYDYIVGDWGYEQLRLKGFYDNDNKHALLDQRIETLEDYLYEYCNFGCRYFVIEKMNKKRDKSKPKPKRRKKKTNSNTNTEQAPAYVEEKVKTVGKNKPVIHRKKNPQTAKPTSHVTEKTTGFTIRQRED